MSVGAAQHHHRSTTKTSNKPFKSRHSSKSALKEQSKGKVSSFEKGTRRTPHQQIMSKLDRRNQAKQRRLNNASVREEKLDVFKGKNGASRIVAVVPLCKDASGNKVVGQLLESVDVAPDRPEQGSWQVEISRFKQRMHFLTPRRDLLECMDAARVADFVLFVLSAEEEVDQLGEQILRCIESQGVSTVMTGVHNIDSIVPAKRRPDVQKSLKSYITHFFATQDKVHDLSSRQDSSNAVRSLCTTTPKGISWREDRSWMVLDGVEVTEQTAKVTGVIRGQCLKADRLVQVGEWGDLQIEKIIAAPLETEKKPYARPDGMLVDDVGNEPLLDKPSEEQDDLAELAPEEITMDDGFAAATSVAPSERKAVLLDDHHYFDEDQDEAIPKPKRLPRGTSKYQAAWYLGDVSDSGSDLESVGDDSDGGEEDRSVASLGPEDGHFPGDATMIEPVEVAQSEYPQSEMFHDDAPEDEADEIESYRRKRRNDAEDDLEFPDEIELHPNVLARERLARYRGLKSLKTSTWETEEDRPYEPEEWQRLLDVVDYKSAKNRVTKDGRSGGVKPGTRVEIHLRIPSDRAAEFQTLPRPTSSFSLLKHEHKRTSCNVSITLSSDYDRPLKSKEDLILQYGPRRLVINPVFSQLGNTPNNIHKFERYLHPGRTAVATFLGPMTWGSIPCLFFQKPHQTQPLDPISDLAQSLDYQSKPGPALIATGTSLAPSTARVIAKRIILTGHPYKIHKKLVTIRYMFFNAEDVNYFRALQLWTKRGRSGFIKEPLGTHGYFKATFDGKINPLDSIGISLYKRVWPRQSRMWKPSLEGLDDQVDEAPQLVDMESDAMTS